MKHEAGHQLKFYIDNKENFDAPIDYDESFPERLDKTYDKNPKTQTNEPEIF